MMGFRTPTDIKDRALQRVGAEAYADSARNAAVMDSMYDKLRRAELRRNPWVFSLVKVALRPIQIYNYSKFLTFGAWASGTTYAVNDVVTGSDGQLYYSTAATNTGNDPTATSGYWALYFGPLTAQEYVTTWSSTIVYALGDHSVGSDGKVYASLIAGNLNNNPVSTVGTDWQIATVVNANDTTTATPSTTGWYAGELIFIGGTVYLSRMSGNTDTPPTVNWLTLTTQPTLTIPQFNYPVGSGPLAQASTRNVFKLPANFLRVVQQDPKAGQTSVMGAPSNLSATDWEYASGFIISSEPNVILFRFAHDESDVTQMDDMFCEGLACRLALESCEILTQSASKLQGIEGMYKTFMSEARAQNGIEVGPTYPPLDDFLQVRY